MVWQFNNSRANLSVILLAFPSWAQEDWCRCGQHIHPLDRKRSKDSTCLLFPFHQESKMFIENSCSFCLHHTSQICHLVTSSAGRLEKYLASLGFINKVGKRNEAGNGCWVNHRSCHREKWRLSRLPWANGPLGNQMMLVLRDLISRTYVHPF